MATKKEVSDAFKQVRSHELLRNLDITADNQLCTVSKGGGIAKRFGSERFTKEQLLTIANLLTAVTNAYEEDDGYKLNAVIKAIDQYNAKNKKGAEMVIRLKSGYHRMMGGYFDVELFVSEGFTVMKKMHVSDLRAGLESGTVYVKNPKYLANKSFED